ncbi:MAG TPA: 4-(cytidine 5'-diphospho)-2-C-methyl-D-erythritol kinase [Desulfomicrobiaceae bacterium]|nr:4-(cytidine 5'-diphospho)-2-C-methyl-D-erythritol kinase [Desulfomicrobiaceae bacterium]
MIFHVRNTRPREHIVTRTTLYPGCKVNLYLEIVSRQAGGYHDLEIMFYPLRNPTDKLVIEERGQGLELSCSDPDLAGRDNILFKAYETYAGETGFRPGLRVTLDKKVPLGGGLGGGSADAGSFLRYLNGRAGTRALSEADLARLAVGLGADVPFFLSPAPAWATGIGERLEPIRVDLSGYTVMLVCPKIHVDTARAYRAWDTAHEAEPAEIARKKILTHYLGPDRKLAFVTSCVLLNSFEEVVFREHPELYALKIGLLARGASGCVLSGSGAGMVALFRKGVALDGARSFLESKSTSFFVHSD